MRLSTLHKDILKENLDYIKEKVAQLKVTNSPIRHEYYEECKTHKVSLSIENKGSQFHYSIHLSNKAWEGIEFFELISRWIEEIKNEPCSTGI